MSFIEVRVRLAEPSDLDAVVALERVTENAPHWSPSTYAKILKPADGPQRCLFVADMSGRLAGFAVGVLHPGISQNGADTGRRAELESIAVAAFARRAGVGRALCVAFLDWCRSGGATDVVLEVRASSAGAIALYTGLGFKQAGRRPRYYRDPEDDALMMRVSLN